MYGVKKSCLGGWQIIRVWRESGLLHTVKKYFKYASCEFGQLSGGYSAFQTIVHVRTYVAQNTDRCMYHINGD